MEKAFDNRTIYSEYGGKADEFIYSSLNSD